MRRLSASVLLALFSFTLIGGAVLADSGSQLPECCRRDGKHHCSTPRMATAPASGPAVQSERVICPSFPAGLTVQAQGYAVHFSGARADILLAAKSAVRATRTASRPSGAFFRSCQKRGPPALLF